MKLILEAIKSLFRKIEAQRTHWEERVEVVVFPETNVTIYENNGYELLSEEHPQLVVGDKYIVLLNGARYECVAEWDEVWSCVILGDSTVDDGSVSGNNEPFYIDSYGDGEIYLNVATAGEYTISILHEATIVHPLDEKYLPEGVSAERIEKVLNSALTAQTTADTANSVAEAARSTADTAQSTAEAALASTPDWNQNDESAPDHVKNRTHYKKTFEYVIYEGDTTDVDMVPLDYEIPIGTTIEFYNWGVSAGKFETSDFGGGIPGVSISKTGIAVTLYFYNDEKRVQILAYNFSGRLKIVAKNLPAFIPLDEKYIPETIARKSDIPAVPDKLPNPNALTFAGAVSGTYDGSSPLTVEIPEGGSGGIVFEDSYISNANNWVTNGYTKTSKEKTINLPAVFDNNSKWGVLFYIAENGTTGTQMLYPIDGNYKGTIWTRACVKQNFSPWKQLLTTDAISNGVRNPNAITFTGSSVGRYDGSEPLTINIPAGLSDDGSLQIPAATETTLGGVKAPVKTDAMTQPVGVDVEGFLFTAPGGSGGEKWELIADVTTTEDVAILAVTTDLNGNDFKLRKALVVAYMAGPSDTLTPQGTKITFSKNKVNSPWSSWAGGFFAGPTNTGDAYLMTSIYAESIDGYVYCSDPMISYNVAMRNTVRTAKAGIDEVWSANEFVNKQEGLKGIDAVSIGSYQLAITAGSRLIVYGVRGE